MCNTGRAGVTLMFAEYLHFCLFVISHTEHTCSCAYWLQFIETLTLLPYLTFVVLVLACLFRLRACQLSGFGWEAQVMLGLHFRTFPGWCVPSCFLGGFTRKVGPLLVSLQAFGRETQVMLAFLFQGAALLKVLCEFVCSVRFSGVVARKRFRVHSGQNLLW